MSEHKDDYCAAWVGHAGSLRSYRCSRKATKGGYCWQHHPDKVREREKQTAAHEAAKFHRQMRPVRALRRRREFLDDLKEMAQKWRLTDAHLRSPLTCATELLARIEKEEGTPI